MRRWNGWGDDGTTYHLPELAAQYLARRLLPGSQPVDVSFDSLVRGVPASSLPPAPFLDDAPAGRLLHARGQSLPDWLGLRYGKISGFPEAVAFPGSDEEIRELFTYCSKTGAAIVPYGGGTSVVGHINPPADGRPYITVDLSRMNRLHDLDEVSRLAEFGAGITGPDLEASLASHGFTLGHYPQSFELSTLGGWIATRSSGQQSYHYGRIEDLTAGLHMETPCGELDLPPLPASAAGPDLRQVALGSEGRMGIITRAWVRIQPQPEVEKFFGVFFPDWEHGMRAVREIAQSRLAVSMLRLSDATETETTLALSGKDRLVAWADRGLRVLGYAKDRCLLILGITGEAAAVKHALYAAGAICREHSSLQTGEAIGKIWRKSRFRTPYLRNTLWERGYALDTLETALPWSVVPAAAVAIQHAIRTALAAFDEQVLVFSHLSHIYPDGASIYTTFLFRLAQEPEETLARWQAMKRAASREIIRFKGTISHQHGVGSDHRAYLAAEKTALGLQSIDACFAAFDPQGLMNPTKLTWAGSPEM
jgi:alkyldihydroxyacetonephosphate synthase